MKRSRAAICILLGAAALLSRAADASQRTFVSTTGLDTNPCSLASPCRSFTAALAQTDPGGEIIAIRSGGYGPVTINKAVAVVSPPGVYAGISVPAGQTGVTINAPAARVVLRGLTINGIGGDDGIAIQSAATVIIDRCVISNTGNGTSDAAIRLAANNVYVFVRDSVLRDNAGDGVVIDSGTNPSLVVERTRIIGNGVHGIHPLAGSSIAVWNSVLADNAGWGYLHTAPASQSISTVIARSTVSRSAGHGIYADAGAGSHVIAVSDTTITRNAGQGIVNSTGVAVITRNAVTRNSVGLANTGVMRSAGDNVVDDNTGADIGAVGAATVK